MLWGLVLIATIVADIFISIAIFSGVVAVLRRIKRRF
jgi:hypothetical protein